MGKYMKKAKATAEVAVMDVSVGGVRTRAKTLALQRRRKSAAAASSATASSGGSYLQLRSRKLRKPSLPGSRRHHKQHRRSNVVGNPNPSPTPDSRSRASSTLKVEGSVGSVSVGGLAKEAKEEVVGSGEAIGDRDDDVTNNTNVDLGIEPSLGENVVEFENRDRGNRESTPCSLMRDPEMIRTPGSTTRPTTTIQTNQRIDSSMQRNIPTAHEMNEFFAAAEEEQQRLFLERYNFDPVNEKPLPGRFEWEKVDP